MRLTEKEYGMFLTKQPFVDIIHKLGQYEDIDDDLGVSWLIIYKVLSGKGVWVKFFGEEPKLYKRVMLRGIDEISEVYHFTLGIDCITSVLELPLRDYGKVWALTKEELLWVKD